MKLTTQEDGGPASRDNLQSAVHSEGVLKGELNGINMCVLPNCLRNGMSLSVVSRGIQVTFLNLRKVWLEGNMEEEV